MRLVKANLRSFRRFEDETLHLGRKVVALVGPNEAGKTSILEALASVEHEDALEPTDFTRGVPKPQSSDPVVTLRFALNDEERALSGGSRFYTSGPPIWYVLEKTAAGRVTKRIEPPLKRPSLRHRQKVATLASRYANRETLSPVLTRAVDLGDKAQPKPVLKRLLERLAKELREAPELLSGDAVARVATLNQVLIHLIEHTDDRSIADQLGHLLQSSEKLLEIEESEHPNELFVAQLEARRPRLRLFGGQDRGLDSEYPVSVLANPPSGLRNLLSLAGLSPRELWESIRTQDHGKRATLEERANATLKAFFLQSWGQSRVHVHLQLDNETVRVLVQAAEGYRPVAERSDGLRAFAALVAFTHSREGNTRQVVLLVDEAETHLHYDAQADLVNVFYRQEEASQVFYTTHSAGCLPRDLGSDVRVVEPTFSGDREESDRSRIRNEFWASGAGFSPLMLAMGASVFALCPTRYAVLAEGPSETVLLPTLLREATGETELPYQVAPGLAAVQPADLKLLSLEAPRVVYYLDGDESGRQQRKRLITAGVPVKSIINLPSGQVLEDLLLKGAYVDAVNRELGRSHRMEVTLSGRHLNDNLPRPTALRNWCAEQEIEAPSKTRVAEHLVDLRREQCHTTLLTKRGAESLRQVSEAICRAFGDGL